MTTRLLLTCVGCLLLAGRVSAAEEEAKPTSHMKEVLRARMAEDAKKKAAATPARKTPAATAPTPATASAPATDATPPPPAAETAPLPVPVTETTAKAGSPKRNQDPTTVMPKVEVKKGRITVLDQQLAKQEEDIARERKNLKPSEVDLALNDAKIAKPLAIFGGESSQFRQRVAAERVALMEAEKDLIQAIAQARTKGEKQDLQKQLDEIRAMRRDLDKSLR